MKKILLLSLLLISISNYGYSQQKTTYKILDLTTQTFKQKVWNFDKSKSFKRVGNMPIILDFHATWCPPCKKLAPHLQAIQNKYHGKLIVYKIDVDEEPELAKLFKVEAMPTIIFINSNTSFTSELGYKDLAEFEALVKARFGLK